MQSVTEVWKPVYGFEGVYEVSDRGRVKRVYMNSGVRNMGRPLKPNQTNSGYLIVGLSVAGKKCQRLVHRLVAEAFIEPVPEGMYVNHINGDKLDNRPVNLEYVTPKESTAHALRIGAMPSGERHFNAKLSYDKVRVIRASKGRVSSTELAREYGVTSSTITRIWNGKGWNYAGSDSVPSSEVQ